MIWSFSFVHDCPVRKRSVVRKSSPWKSFTLVPQEELERTEISKAGSIELDEIEEGNLIPISKADEQDNLVRLLIQEPSVNISEKDIEKACYDWMENSRRFDYAGGMVNGKARLVECMLAPVDLRINGGKKILKGSWTMTIRIIDDELLEELETKGEIKIAGKRAREI